MNSNALESVVFAIVSLVLAGAGVVFGMNLLPEKAAAEQAGTVVPWFLTWVMIGLTALSAILVAGYLIMSGMSEKRRY